MRIQGHIVLLNIVVEFLSAEDLCNLDELVVVVLALEERLLLEDHASEHTTKRPDVQRVIIGLQINEQLRALEVTTGYSYVVLLARVIEFGETPIDKAKFARSMVDHDIVRLDISVGDTLGVAEVEGL